MIPKVLGLDIGGANLKAATADGKAWTVPFAVWKNPAGLAGALVQLLAQAPDSDTIAITMTAELCDCYETKRDGVNAILSAVEHAAGSKRVLVWQTAGEFVLPSQARSAYAATAASNWLALAALVGRSIPDVPALLMDIGSTTTDIIPIHSGKSAAKGRSDVERLANRELVYMGVLRTPIHAVMTHWNWRGKSIRPAAEWFATAKDTYLLLGEIADDWSNQDTADGRPATAALAHDRMARTLCADGDEISHAETIDLARQFREAQIVELLDAALQVRSHMPTCAEAVVLSGVGEFLGRRVVELMPGIKRLISLSAAIGPQVSAAACAYAVAVLAEERCRS